jgi:hypothetical protein
MAAATAVVMVAVIMAAAIAVAVMVTATISAAGIMAAAIFTAGRRISAHSPDIVRFRHIVRISRAAAGR